MRSKNAGLSIFTLYNFRGVCKVANALRTTPLNPTINGVYVLVRYCKFQPLTDIPADCFWTEFRTSDLTIAGEGTGIPDTECLWRVEWSFPVASADLLVTGGETRASDVGWFIEYTNNKIVPLADCEITQM